MDCSWKSVWDGRCTHLDHENLLQSLIHMDGFDVGAGGICVDDWLGYTKLIAEILQIENGESVFEVGCGSGAFLFGLLQYKQIKVGGLDYSKALIEVAETVLDGDFYHLEATYVSEMGIYDFYISNGVFHYFDEPYAKQVLGNMLLKSRRAVLISEVPMLDKFDESEEHRRGSLGLEEYERKYKNLKHTYFTTDFFSDVAKKLGFEAQFYYDLVPNYSQGKFRFSVVLQRKNLRS